MGWRDGSRLGVEGMITSMTDEVESSQDFLPVRREASMVDMAALAEELVASAAERGVELTGDNGLLTALTRQVLQTALQVEMAQHLGYDKHDPAGRGSPNSRNGTSPMLNWPKITIRATHRVMISRLVIRTLVG